ncbi:ABC transporter permease subunit [Leifsonia sp. PS1209]|uniref:ABC transporter permease subunit n=1 Tax=Leifsonia sp. PS1209 TaxID=2724914 RepID=UPI001442E563|nr:ABC transporter permease subunit [Leifsonia sp. PS1209]QIZ98621.1 ABC transporter permease subunit [Leifsonia sp. PS1209]
MSTATATAPIRHTSLGHLNFARVVRSEWIKLRSLRSTFWTYAIVVVIGLGMTCLVAFTIPDTIAKQVPAAQHSAFVVNTASFGVTFGQLAVAVLGVLAISGEYSTGMIRSSFAAVPKRLPVLAAKAIVLFIASFVVGVVTVAGSWAIAAPVLSGKGFSADFASADTLWAIVGAGAYLGLVSVFALGLGTILRAGAGGIAAALGVVFLLPIIVNLVGSLTNIEWITKANNYLISAAGAGMAGSDNGGFEPWANVLIVLAWTAVSFVIGAIILKRRDA